jgi:hypothetical protein
MESPRKTQRIEGYKLCDEYHLEDCLVVNRECSNFTVEPFQNQMQRDRSIFADKVEGKGSQNVLKTIRFITAFELGL